VSGGFDQAVRARADRAGVLLTDLQIGKLRAYYELLSQWTRTINLTALPLDGYPDRTIDHLIVEPLLAARVFPAGSTNWMDLGTGGGSPAVPLRIVQSGGSLEMVESRERKAAFLRETVRTLELVGTGVRTSRIEDVLASAARASGDVITMRAVKPTFAILQAAAHFLRVGGRFLVFGSSEGAAAALGEAGVEDAGFEVTETAPLIEPGHRLLILVRR